METDVDERGTDGEPGPRLARTLAEQAAATEARHARRRKVLGLAFVVVGITVAVVAAWSILTKDDNTERKVGKLAASHLGADAKSGSGTKVASVTVAKGSGKGTSTKGSTTTVPTTAKKPHWPPAVAGRPVPFGGLNDAPPQSAGILEEGFYLWTDFDGWHLWQVGGASSDGVTITADYAIAKADPTGGSVDATADGNLLTFARGSASERVVGVDFSPGIYTKTMVVTVNGDLPLHLGRRPTKAPSYYGLALTTS